jgi:1-deoxy-D-xylulose-5-phosphate reductoisomerase
MTRFARIWIDIVAELSKAARDLSGQGIEAVAAFGRSLTDLMGGLEAAMAVVSDFDFEPPDPTRFPGLNLAYEVLTAPEGSSVVLNAANDVAVAAFLEGQVPFTAIHGINQDTLGSLAGRFAVPASLEDLLDLDARARAQATALVKRLTKS